MSTDSRNKEIYRKHNEGMTYTEIAEEYGISRQRAEQIYVATAGRKEIKGGDLWKLKIQNSLRLALLRNGVFTYREARSLTIDEMMGWDGVGPVKAKAIFDFFHGVRK